MLSASLAILAVPAALNAADPVRIMCVGDSITAGYTDNSKWSVPFEFGYRSGLYTSLTRDGNPVRFVGDSSEPWNGVFGKPQNTPVLDLRKLGQDGHRGYGGQGTEYILSNIGAWLKTDKPDIILLMIGINDLGRHKVAMAESNLNSIVNIIVTQQPKADLIVAQITPGANNGYVLQEFQDYNSYIREKLVPSYQKQGKHVSTVDQYANFSVKNGKVEPTLFSNGINHPTAVQYELMAQTWLAGIYALKPQRVPSPKVKKSAAGMDGSGGATGGQALLDQQRATKLGAAVISLVSTNADSLCAVLNSDRQEISKEEALSIIEKIKHSFGELGNLEEIDEADLSRKLNAEDLDMVVHWGSQATHFGRWKLFRSDKQKDSYLRVGLLFHKGSAQVGQFVVAKIPPIPVKQITYKPATGDGK